MPQVKALRDPGPQEKAQKAKGFHSTQCGTQGGWQQHAAQQGNCSPQALSRLGNLCQVSMPAGKLPAQPLFSHLNEKLGEYVDLMSPQPGLCLRGRKKQRAASHISKHPKWT